MKRGVVYRNMQDLIDQNNREEILIDIKIYMVDG
jgi:hypothetical protein